MNAFHRRLSFLVLALGVLSTGSILAADIEPPIPPLPTELPKPRAPRAPGVKTNRTALFAQPTHPTAANPVLPPALRTPPPSLSPSLMPQAPGLPAPLLQPQRPTPVFPAAPAAPTQPASYVQWDAESKEYTAKPGEPTAHFTFYLTNVSKEVVLINSVRTSCGC